MKFPNSSGKFDQEAMPSPKVTDVNIKGITSLNDYDKTFCYAVSLNS